MLEATVQLKKWKGNFGKNYTNRNTFSLSALEKMYRTNYGIKRTELNEIFLGKTKRSIRILEVGVNTGNQLLCLQKMGFTNLYGIEPQEYAIELSKKRTRNINIIKGDVFDIPFKDNYFDIVFTSGVLIHINPRHIKKALREIYRCTKKYIWGFEYYSDKYTDILYRGNKNLLWKANFPKIYADAFPGLKIMKIKFFKYLNDDNTDVMFLLKKQGR